MRHATREKTTAIAAVIRVCLRSFLLLIGRCFIVSVIKSESCFCTPFSIGQTSWVVVAKQPKEILILVNYEKVIDAESIVVTFWDGTHGEARIQEKDANTKLAVISVPVEGMGKETADAVTAADLTASSRKRAIMLIRSTTFLSSVMPIADTRFFISSPLWELSIIPRTCPFIFTRTPDAFWLP